MGCTGFVEALRIDQDRVKCKRVETNLFGCVRLGRSGGGLSSTTASESLSELDRRGLLERRKDVRTEGTTMQKGVLGSVAT
jgi:hypothetical protein